MGSSHWEWMQAKNKRHEQPSAHWLDISPKHVKDCLFCATNWRSRKASRRKGDNGWTESFGKVRRVLENGRAGGVSQKKLQKPPLWFWEREVEVVVLSKVIFLFNSPSQSFYALHVGEGSKNCLTSSISPLNLFVAVYSVTCVSDICHLGILTKFVFIIFHILQNKIRGQGNE